MFSQIYILILTLWFLILPCFLAKIAQILQNWSCFFLERGEEIEPWFWHIWIAQWLKVSPLLLIFFDFGHLQVETCGQNWTKSANFGSVSFSLILQFLFKKCFCLREYYLWWEFRQYLTIFGRVRAQKPPKKGHFMDAESVRKTLKTFNLTTSNAIMMKLITIMYLHKSVNRKLNFWRNVHDFLK